MNIRWLNAVTIPRDAEHSIASGFGNEGVCPMFAHIGRNDVFDSPVATETASNTYIAWLSQYLAGTTGRTTYPARASHR
jgi:hypothetical protein